MQDDGGFLAELCWDRFRDAVAMQNALGVRMTDLPMRPGRVLAALSGMQGARA